MTGGEEGIMVIFTALYFLCGITYVIIGMVTFLNDSKNKLNKIFLKSRIQ